MALLFMDSFDHYATADILKKWSVRYDGTNVTTDPVVSASNGRHSSNSCRFTATNAASQARAIGKIVPASGATAVFGFAFKHTGASFTNINSASPPNNGVSLWGASNSCSRLCGLRHPTNGYNNTQMLFVLNQSGTISAWSQTSNIVSGFADWILMGTTSTGISHSVMHNLQFKVVLATTAVGSVEIKIDGVTVLNATTIQTVYTSYSPVWNELAIGGLNIITTGTINWDFDDIWVADGSGSYNTTFLGDMRVDALMPSAAGNSNMSTPSTGSDRSATVDETSANGDTDYNTFAAVSDKDTYAFGNCPISGATVPGVQIVAWARGDSAGVCGVKAVERSSGTDYLGTVEKGVPGDYVALTSLHDRSIVDGTTAWTTAEIDAAEFGLQKTT